jgi:hypothetical protein
MPARQIRAEFQAELNEQVRRAEALSGDGFRIKRGTESVVDSLLSPWENVAPAKEFP